MMADFPTVHVTAPSRLHFGLLSFGRKDVPQYGGVGMMVDLPALKLCITPSLNSDWEFCGPGADRAETFAKRWVRSQGDVGPYGCRIAIAQLPPPHTGLGSGTQLALSVAAGLNGFFGRKEMSPCQLAHSVGRAVRSTVGTFGFRHGGLIWESGKLNPPDDAVLESREPIPSAWCVVLIRSMRSPGKSGDAERDAFARLPAVPLDITKSLRDEVSQHMLPAAAATDFDSFGESVYRYGRIAGNCFASVQSGPYGGDELVQIIQTLRSWDVRGVGQSSWGPTLYAMVPHSAAADLLVARIEAEMGAMVDSLSVSLPNNTGATVRVVYDGETSASQ